MENQDRPPLSADVWEAVESKQHEIHREYWIQLGRMQVPKNPLLYSYHPVYKDHPPSKQPKTLGNILTEYASSLFQAEANEYPDAPELDAWLLALASRTVVTVMEKVVEIDACEPSRTLTYHATIKDMRLVLLEAVRQVYNFQLGAYRENSSNQMAKPVRLSASVECPSAARKLEAFLKANGIGQTEFAIQAQTTDRTLRTFRKTGKVRRDIFENIAKAMGTTKESLLNE